MSTTARKARKRAGIPFTKPQKTATRPYESAYDAKKRRATERRSIDLSRPVVERVMAAMNASLTRFRRSGR